MLGCDDHVLIAGYRQIIRIGTHKGIVFRFGQEIIYVDCEKEEGMDGSLDRPSLNVLEGPMEPFTRTLAVPFMNQEDSHSVRRWERPSLTYSSGVLYAKHDRTPD